jgi:hypothetical protein
VEDGNDPIDVAEGTRSFGRVEDHEAVCRGISRQHDGGAGCRGDFGKCASDVERQLSRVTVREDPATLACDSDRYDLELVRVERAQDAAGGKAGNGVLGAATAEHDCDSRLSR